MRQFNYIFDMVHHNPGEPKTESSFLDPEVLWDYSYNGQVLFCHVQGAITYDSLDPKQKQFSAKSKERRWIEKQGVKIDEAIEKAKAAGILFLAFTDFVVFPKKIMEKYHDDICCDGDKGGNYQIHGDVRPDIHKPMTQKLVKVMVNEIFDRFPQLDGLVVRVGETYLHDMPYHSGGNPISRGIDSHVTLINLLREEVCSKRNKHIFYRTWLSGIDTSQIQYLNVTDFVKPHPKLTFCVKHCTGDFHRTNPFSQVIGIGRHPQIIEIQCQREYEGKGAHPNYIAQGVIDGFEEYQYLMRSDEKKSLRDIANKQVFAGIWTWSRGGGWNGPYIKNEFWCQLNAYVLAKWAEEPERHEEDLFKEFAELSGFDETNTEILRQIALMSAKGVLRGHSSPKGHINVWWTRDDYIGGESELKETFQKLIKSGRFESALAEKQEAAAIWQTIENLAAKLTHDDNDLLQFIRISCTYGRLKYAIFAAGWTAMLLKAAGMAFTHQDQIQQAITAYQTAWNEWQVLEAKHPEHCSSLYKNHYCQFKGRDGMQPAPGIQHTIDQLKTLLANVPKA